MDTYLSDFVYNFISCSFRLMCANLLRIYAISDFYFFFFFFFIKNQHRFFPISRFLKSSQFSFHFTPILIQLGLQIEQLLLSKLLNVFLNIYTLFETKIFVSRATLASNICLIF